MDLSHAVLDRSVLHSDGTYKVPNMRIQARICRTNQASNTAFRGFGGPQGMLVANTWMSHLAGDLGIPFETVQERNMYQKADPVTHFMQARGPLLRALSCALCNAWDRGTHHIMSTLWDMPFNCLPAFPRDTCRHHAGPR